MDVPLVFGKIISVDEKVIVFEKAVVVPERHWPDREVPPGSFEHIWKHDDVGTWTVSIGKWRQFNTICRLRLITQQRTVTTWRQAAQLLGTSDDTLWRRRKQFDPARKDCFFADEDELRNWYASLRAPEPKRAARR